MILSRILDKKEHIVLFVAGFAAASCLVAEPIDIDEPEKSPPFMHTDQAVPITSGIHQTVSGQGGIPFTVPFTSEDYGEKVVGKLFINYGSEGAIRELASQAVTGASGRRDMTIEWPSPGDYEEGCYPITMIISHQSNFPQDTLQEPIDSELASYVTWWVAHDLELHELTLFDCPHGAPGSKDL